MTDHVDPRRIIDVLERAADVVESDNYSFPDLARSYAAVIRGHLASVAIFCGALAGALDATTRSLIAAHVVGDPDAWPVLRDHAETIGLTTEHAQWLPVEQRQRWLCDEPGCQLEIGHDSLHREVTDGRMSEWRGQPVRVRDHNRMVINYYDDTDYG